MKLVEWGGGGGEEGGRVFKTFFPVIRCVGPKEFLPLPPPPQPEPLNAMLSRLKFFLLQDFPSFIIHIVFRPKFFLPPRGRNQVFYTYYSARTNRDKLFMLSILIIPNLFLAQYDEISKWKKFWIFYVDWSNAIAGRIVLSVQPIGFPILTHSILQGHFWNPKLII